MSICSAVFGVVDASGVDANKPKLLPLSRAAAQELVLLSILCPLASADLSAPLDPVLYAADASEDKGGYVLAEVGTEVTRPLWRTATKKGGYSRPWSREEAVLSPFYDKTRFRAQGCCWRWHLPPTRPLAFFFDFREIGHSSVQVSTELRRVGRCTGPLIDLSQSPAFDLRWLRTLEWLYHLLQHKRLRSFLVVPPFATFGFVFPSACRSAASLEVVGQGVDQMPRQTRWLCAPCRCSSQLFNVAL